MGFKYAGDLEKLKNCPDKEFQPAKRIAHRFTHANPPSSGCFIPIGKLNPAGNANKDDAFCCCSFALSFYDTEENARAAFAKRLQTNPNAWKRIGQFLAVGELLEADGYCSAPSGTGHFSLHEAEGCELFARFAIVSDLLS